MEVHHTPGLSDLSTFLLYWMQTYVFLLISRQGHQVTCQQYTPFRCYRRTCDSPLLLCTSALLVPCYWHVLNYRLNVRDSILDKSQLHGSEIVSLPRFVGTSSTNDDGMMAAGSADKWLATEAYSKLQGSSEVFDGMAKPSVGIGEGRTGLVEK